MFIPESNIVERGYTQGDQFILPSNEFYKGFYHKDNQNRYWTGEKHTNQSIQLRDLIKLANIDQNTIAKNNYLSAPYSKKYSTNLDTPLLTNEVIQPTADDYINGIFTRYVAQLKAGVIPEQNIVEITKNTFDNATRNTNTLKAYKLASFGWKLTGPLNDEYNGNIRIEDGVLDTNLRSLNDVSRIITNINLFITNPLQFYIKPVEPRIE